MKVGDIVYYVNSGRTIDEFLISFLNDNGLITLTSTDELPVFSVIVEEKLINNIEKGRFFTERQMAEARKFWLDEKYEYERLTYYDKLLDDAIVSTDLFDDIIKDGTLIYSKFKTVYDIKEGSYSTKLYLYKKKKYIIITRILKGETSPTRFFFEVEALYEMQKYL